MSKKSRISIEIKLEVVRKCLRQNSNPHYEANQLGVDKEIVKDWIRKYEAEGSEGLKESRVCKTYSRDLKEAAIRSVLSGHYSIREATKHYHISSNSVLSNWISKYTCREEIKPTRKGIARMNKGRRTTYEERIEIVQFTIAHDLDYQQAIKKYSVSYQQVYAWVQKYKAMGQEALQDRRGRKKQPEELNEQEQLQLRIKELEARNEYLEMENAN
ncbi:helix-turn-helix domain-containing protein [Paenibacillus sanguinis]|uniref:helix-turn-helix domain-containing protein n=1 Tax=Paenibacillus sanguinis TaxID=225906 RepID=UPI00035EFE5E|nr:helix-turn-helix domain-containing protein [Paenibacillus sanguinis]